MHQPFIHMASSECDLGLAHLCYNAFVSCLVDNYWDFIIMHICIRLINIHEYNKKGGFVNFYIISVYIYL